MMERIAFFSLTGQTRRFIQKLNEPAYEILPGTSPKHMEVPYLLIVPTYDLEALTPVIEFLKEGQNQMYLKAVAGSGNRNFGPDFVHSPKAIAQKMNVPFVFAFEFNGTEQDVHVFQQVLNEFV